MFKTLHLEYKKTNIKAILLLVQVFVVSVCSLVYELLLATTISNITGNSVLAFSVSIGLFLAGLGAGAWLSGWIKDYKLSDVFVKNETLLALIGGLSVILIYLSLIYTPYFTLTQVILTTLIGVLSGLEIPILTRILNNDLLHEEKNNSKNTSSNTKSNSLGRILANVLSFDYLGGLAASLLFPLLLLPYFGLVQLSALTGLANISMALLGIWLFWDKLKNKISALFFLSFSLIALIVVAIFSVNIYGFIESGLYRDPIIYSTQTKYQRIVLTKRGEDIRLYINGGIQFSSVDEYRYHESLIMPAIISLLEQNPSAQLNIAIFGGGDGMVVRQLLKFEESLAKIYLIDIDPIMTDLAKNTNFFRSINQNSLNHPKVSVLNQDAWEWVKNQTADSIDLIISDLPDPDDTAIAKLYSKEFFVFCKRLLRENGLLVSQSSSPYSTPLTFWSINKTLNSVFPKVWPYQAYIPSFGLWGFNITSKNNTDILPSLDNVINLKSMEVLNKNQFIKPESLKQLFSLDEDVLNPKLKNGKIVNKEEIKINTLDNLILVRYYTENGMEVME